ncbi:SDR family NAD(P)-dependent oxidoreductase [Streptomyces sp. NPDC058619]|uniref:SDR family NAD(P)-dependent oxidoreductase n=1 Tax=unclassified Streptomyces TaxID=2593676 RepID=UPI0036463465
MDRRSVRCALHLKRDNPIVDDHRVHGVRTLPGVTFLDIVYRLLAARAVPLDRTELSDVLFVEPVVTTDSFDRELTVDIAPDGAVFRVTATSRRIRDGLPVDDSVTTHLRATLRTDLPPLTGAPGLQPSGTPRDVGEVYATGRSAGIEHRAFMRCAGTLRATADRVRAEIALGDEARSTVGDFLLHPALLDGSTMQSYALAFDGAEADGRPLIPLHIGSFRAARTLGDACTVDLRMHPAGAGAGDDVVKADIELRDGSGALAARFTDLTFKRVRSVAAITRLAAERTEPAPRAAAPAVPAQPEGPADPVRADGGPLDIRAEVVELVRRAVADPALVVEGDRGFYDLGLDSSQLLTLVRLFEEHWDIALYPTLLFEYPTVDAVAAHLAGLWPAERPARPAPAAPADTPARTHCLTGLWQAAPRPLAPAAGPLLVIGDQRVRTDQITVRRGPAFRRVAPHTYELRPCETGDLRLLLADLAGLGTAPEAVLHVADQDAADLPEAVRSACGEVLALAQALADRPVPVVHVGPAPVAAAVAGLARTVRLEQPRLAITAVECEGPADTDALLAELADHGESWVRHTPDGRHVRRYRDADPGPAVPLRPGGVYLITGGAGGIGRELAARMTALGATAVLVGRTPRPAGPEGPYVRADVTVPAEVDALVSGILERHGRLDGVVHAAGVLRDGLFTTKAATDLTAVLAPKVRGAVLLDEATRHLDLDFFALFSSVTGVAGNAGQSDYAAANAFLDAYARDRGLLSLAWPLWAEGGMRTDAAAEALFARQGQAPLPTTAGLDVFERALALSGTELVVLHGDPDRAREALGLTPADAVSAGTTPTGTTPTGTPAAPRPGANHGTPEADDRDVAVIGVAGRYPMAEDLDRFWSNLSAGRDCVTEIPADRWTSDGFYRPDRAPGHSYSKWGGFLEGIDEFDPGFFRITPREAAGMDPQERLFLQTSWHALESAGLTRADVAGRMVGVFAGVMFNQYQMLGLGAEDRLPVLPTSFSSAVANRVSAFLDLRGPSLALDTMCSSSLTALHLACESLRSGDSELALAGGVNLIVHPYKYLHLSQVGFVSSDGRCRAFGADGDGYVPGEGVGVVVLKPLPRALEDGDRVLAVIKGSAVNHGGRAGGFFVPNPAAQADVVRRALGKAGVDPASVGYIEAHGTGTSLGDPIEITALSQAYGDARSRLGSVKSGIGHLESAAGIAGLTKILLQLRHRTLVPSLHADPANTSIDWDSSGLRVQRESEPWPAGAADGPRRAGISAFGAGGSNAHVIVEEFQQQTPATEGSSTAGPQVVLLSARTPQALRELAERYAEPTAGDPLDAVAEVAEAAGLAGADPEAELDELGLDVADLRRLARVLADRFPGRAPYVDARSTLAGLAEAVSAGAGPEAALADIAYTTQIGREPLEERLAVVASDTAGLRTALHAFLTGSPAPALHRGTVTGQRPAGDPLAAGPLPADPYAWARSWAEGATPDWRALHRDRQPRKVELPQYPFARVRCWVDVPAPQQAAFPSAGAAAEPPVERLPLDVPTWEAVPTPTARPAPDGAVVVLHAPTRAGLARELAARHEDAALAELGTHPLGVTPRLVYVLAGPTDTADTAVDEAERVARAEDAGVKALAPYARAWSREHTLDWVIVTTGAAAPPGRSVTDPYAAGITGFARVMENEHRGWSVACVDLDPAHVSAALLAPAPRGTRVAYTGTVRHAQVLRPAPAADGPVPLRRGGTYVIVGGARGIGLAIARRLVEDWDAHVVLVGRSELADPDLGDRIRYARADATDPGRLAAVLDEAGPVHGVVHAALVRRDRLVRDLTDTDLALSLAAKSGVAAALADALRGRNPDFLVFFSSAQSFLGDPGLANYAAGSTFLDAYAHALDARLPYPVRAVDWGFWGTVGAVADDTHRDRLTAAGFRSITPRAGFAALVETLRRPAPQSVVVPGTEALRERMAANRKTESTDVTPTSGRPNAADVRVVEDFHALDRQMTRIAGGALLALLDDLGTWHGPDPDADEVLRRVGVTPRYERLLRTVLDALVGDGLLTAETGRLRPAPDALAGARAGGHLGQLAALADAHPESAVFVRLLALCLERYPELLRGELLATDLLFPSSGTSLMERVYRGNPISDLYNDLLTRRLVAHVEERLAGLPADATVRILEVGSGTGGTSAGLLRALAPYGGRLEYWYTDLSVTFLAHGRQEFGARYPFLRFKRFDLDTDPVGQGFDEGGFDLVVGANVLHATSDVGRALRHLRRVLRTGGELLLNELTTVTLSGTLTYGLFDGWWAHGDTGLRLPGSPLLDVPGWTGVLGEAGYEAVTASPESARTTRNFQHVLVARAAAGATAPAGTRATGIAQATGAATAAFADTLLDLTSDASGIPVGELDLDRQIGDYGFDSVSYNLLASRLNEAFGLDLTPALFYETPTLRALADRLARDHRKALPTAAPPAAALPVARADEDRPATASAARPVVDPEAIAVIGMSGRMPGSADLGEFWDHLVEGDDLVTDVPADRWDRHALPEGVHASRGGFIHDVDRFDPLFFGISPHEAEGMDPQQRLVLEGVWTALEDAGLAPGSLAGADAGLFVGAGSSDYEEIRKAAGLPVDAHAATATAHSILVNRVSYQLDLHGPSEPVNTGCSSSLVAIHRAAESIRSGECDIAVAGGVNLVLSPHNHVLLSSTGMLSPTGRCRTFDARADGFVRGEGYGFVVLARAERARGRQVRAWLRGTAVNHGGRARSLTAPNPAAQAAMIVRAHERAGTDPATLGYLETHGTGTELGDPVEINGLRLAFDELLSRRGTPPPAEPYCAIGAVKANIGHLESAAGAAGVIKVLLAMEHGVQPPLAGLREQNPHLRLDGSPFQLLRSARAWPMSAAGPRRAGVSSFGYGGVNAHVVLEEAGAAPEVRRPHGPWVFPLSARTPQALRRYATALLAAVERADRTPELADVAHTLQHGRDAMAERLAVTAADRFTLVAALEAAADGADHPALARPAGGADADRWVAGDAVDWPAGGVSIPLPTYPFERRRCWVAPVAPPGPEADDAPATAGPVPASTPPVPAPTVRAGAYAPGWQPVADVALRGPASGPVWVLGPAELPGAEVHRIGTAPLESLPTPVAVHAVVEGERGVLDLFRIVHHLQARPGAGGELALTVVTRAATDPASAAARGLARSVRSECERWRVATVDTGPEDPTAVPVAAPGDYALHAGRWYREVLQPVDATAEAAPVLREGGTYVIVGGTGDVGLDIAEQLVRRHRARVVLVGRSTPDEDRAARIRAFDPSGTRVEFHRADASEPGRLRAVLDRVGVVHGVLHSVTVPSDRSLAAMDEEWFLRGMAAKSRTTEALAEALGDRRPDFLALFSSVQSFLGNPGQAAYAAGCTAQDAIGRALAARLPYPVRVVNWGAWAGSALTERHLGRLAAAGVHPLSPEAGFEALSRVLGRQEVQVAVVSGTDEFLGRIGVPAAGADVRQRPATSATPAAGSSWRAAAADEILAVLREVAGIRPEELAPDDLLSRFGFDSITYTRLSSRMNARWDLDLTPATFFGVATADDLIGKILQHHGAALAAHWSAEALPGATAPEGTLAPEGTPAPDRAPAAEPAAAPEPARAQAVAAEALTAAPVRAAAPVPVTGEPVAVAIVGMAGMLPGSDDLDEFWEHLTAGDDLVDEIPADRWDWRRLHGEPTPGEFRTTAKWGGFLPRVDLFDPQFFGISPHEAMAMDPQHRLVLEAAWSAIENAGIQPSALAGTDTGVFIGSSTYDYFELQHALGVPLDGYSTVGRAHAIMSNRVSYLLDLHGPSETIDTACSSSLVAVHRAAEAIRGGDCEVALAGGVNVIASPTLFVDMSQADMLSPDGRCRTFDARANGIVRAEGVGVVVLKRLDAAIADGDVIHAVLRGSAVNHGGRTNSLTAPNPDAQAACIVKAHRRAGVDPRTVGYVETHGTGTELGDPIEVEGLKSAFGELYADHGAAPGQPHVVLGAVKTNTGHLEAAAGVTGLIKALLAMRHGAIPGNVHLETLNPHLRLDGSPLRLPSGNEPWNRVRTADGAEAPLRAGVSSFGLGGVNAHLVVEEYREAPVLPTAGERLFVLSAKTPERLRDYAVRLAHWVADHEDVDPAALAHTLSTGREAFPERLAVVADSLRALVAALEAWQAGGPVPGVFAGDGKDATTALLLDGPEGGRYLRAVVDAGRLDKVARLWVGGAPVDWAELWPGTAPRRVPAPTYPFARESYWLTPGARFDALQAAEAGLVADAAAEAGTATGVVAAARTPAVVETPAPAQPAEAGAPAGDDAEGAVRTHVRGLLAAHLGMRPERLPLDRALSDAGVDSLGLRRLSRRLGADYQVEVPTRMFGVAQTVRAVARAVFEAYGPLPVPQEQKQKQDQQPDPDPAPASASAADKVAALLAGLRDGTVRVDDALAVFEGGAGR